jgi:hypothetical protein
LVLALAVPGFAFLSSGRRALGVSVLLAYAFCLVSYLAALGYAVGNIAWGLAISLHAMSVIYLEGHWLGQARFRIRLGLAFCTLLAFWGLLYAPLLGYAERHWLLPLRLADRVIIVNLASRTTDLKRGDLVAYRIESESHGGNHEGAVYLQAGFGIERILGLPGDHVRFTKDSVLISGQVFPRAPHMPAEGEWVVPEKTWFIWPKFGISGHGVPETAVSAAMQRAALVSEPQLVGKPFKHWFGRRQLL